MSQPPAFWKVFGRIGLLSFGGPAAQIALMHRELVDERKWLSETDFLRALSFCMLLPGPEAMQLATYAGWKIRGVPGGLLAGLLFVLPGAAVILALAAAYVAFGNLPFVSAIFLGVKASVVIIVIEALLRVARRTMKGGVHWSIAALSFVGIFLFDLPFPLIILAAGIVGTALLPRAMPTPLKRPRHPHLLATLAIGLTAWFLPLGILALAGQDFLLALGLFFSKLAVVTFGGAYAVLAYMTQTVVQDLGWLSTAEMIDALGLAETTPGPLILVTEFVGYLAGHAHGGITMALAAVALTLWVTFTPCFLWVFAFAPYLEWITGRPRLTAALAGVMAAVVGVIANLALWFALQVFFSHSSEISFGPVAIRLPDVTTFDIKAGAIAVLAALMLLRWHWNLFAVLSIAALAGFALGSPP
ncbi:MAG: chromate efflux transporter [Albidovulum sp.]